MAQLATWIAQAPSLAKSHGFDRTETASERVVTLPPGWEGKELAVSFEDGMGYRQQYRMIVCGKAFAHDVVMLVITVPDSIAKVAPDFMALLIRQTRPI
jgi:hypothetical protein